MQHRLTLDNTSQTFKEAINVTRRLGIPYLWIDSLCILQDKDDLSDWKMEAPKMSAVYNSATVTISAASSVDTAGGLFPRKEDRKSRNDNFEVRIPRSSTESTNSVFVRERFGDPFNIGEAVHSAVEVEIPHLRSRGWVLQEDFLSPRILHFRKEELAWTCSTYTRCECRIRPSLPMPPLARAAAGTIEEERKPELTYRLGIQWPMIVMEYSRRNLTQPSDRIAALSGLANYMEECTNDTYFCGMWYEDLRFQLLWYADWMNTEDGHEAKTGHSRFGSSCAPSWSWMSVPAPISYYERHPAGSAPSHSATRSSDAIEPVGWVLNVGRIPVDWDNPVGELLMAPLFLLTMVLPVRYDIATKQWEARYDIEDFLSTNLRVSIDVETDDPDDNSEAEYVFILAGQWVGQGMTFACMQAVCILARRLGEAGAELTWVARQFQMKLGGTIQASEGGNNEDSNDDEDPNMPNPSNSYQRVGLVRGAGSLDAWGKAGVPGERIFLF
ncbi:Fc.00g081130.m01.CDS01 [Cosmosporella sp. VM-42]